jgi:hypothetical protein
LVERGIQSPNIVVLLKIADVPGVVASELIARTEEMIQAGQNAPKNPPAASRIARKR